MNRPLSFAIRVLALALLFGTAGGYAYFRSRDYLEGPVIVVDSPLADHIVSSSTVIVSGNIANAVSVTLDGRTIFLDPHGAFREKLLVPMGYTIITLAATDRFGKTAKRQIGIVRTSASPGSAY